MSKKAQQRTRTRPAVASIAEVSKTLGTGINQTYEAAHKGEIPIIKIGNRMLVPRAWLDRVLQREPADATD